jgi:hypothetical protein
VEHLRAFQNSQPANQTAVAENMLMKDGKNRNYEHEFYVSGLKLVKPVNNHRKLDFLESYFVRKHDRQCLMNQVFFCSVFFKLSITMVIFYDNSKRLKIGDYLDFLEGDRF